MLNNFIKPGLQDLCVSRTSFDWGIPVDFDPKHVVYVWLDALTNYITNIGYDVENPSEEFKKWWPADLHLIGKDIVRFHSIYWPAFLWSLDIELPKQIFGHPWLLTNNDKIGKSRGNAIYADDLVEKYGVAGGIHQPSPGADQLGTGVKNLRLPPGAHFHSLLAPVGNGSLLLPEHALAGAGCIDKHPVKLSGKPAGQGGGMLVGHQGVGDAHPLDVPGEDFRPFGTPFIAQQEALSQHSSRDLGGLSAGSGTEVTDPFTGLGIQQGNRGHGTGLL